MRIADAEATAAIAAAGHYERIVAPSFGATPGSVVGAASPAMLRAAGAHVSDVGYHADRVLEASLDFNTTEERLLALSSDASTLDRVRLVSQTVSQLQEALRRKDEALDRVEQQLADVTHVVETQSKQRTQLEEMLQTLRDQVEQEVKRRQLIEQELNRMTERALAAEHSLQMEVDAHSGTKRHFHTALTSAEQNWKQARKELEDRDTHREQVEREREQLREQELSRNEKLVRSEATAREKVNSLEMQLRTLRTEKAAVEETCRTVAADTQYISTELQTLKSQYELKAEEALLSDQNVEKHKLLLDQLTRELNSVKEDLAAAVEQLNVIPALRRDVSGYESLKVQFDKMREENVALDAELTAQTNVANVAHMEVTKLSERMRQQSDLIAQMQAARTEYIATEVQVADLKGQLATAQFELTSVKNQLAQSQASTVAAQQQSSVWQEQVALLQGQREEWEAGERKLRDALEARHRAMKTAQEQIKQLVDRNPFIKRFPAATSSSSSASAPASSSAAVPSASPVDAEFTALRDSLHAVILEIHSQHRQSWSLFTEAEQAANDLREEAAEKKRAITQVQRTSEEAIAEHKERYLMLESECQRIRQDLHLAQSQVTEVHESGSMHRKQLRSLWMACRLLVRALAPLSARFTDLAAQKTMLARESHLQADRTAREIVRLRSALSKYEESSSRVLDENKSKDPEASPFANRPPHPYRLHSPRISFRAAVIAVLAAKRFWVADARYGLPMQVGGQCIFLTREAAAGVSSSSATTASGQTAVGADAERLMQLRERQMIVPVMDDSTPAGSAASILKLIDHFDPTSKTSILTSPFPQLVRPGGDDRPAVLVNAPSSSLITRPSLVQLLAVGFKANDVNGWRKRVSAPVPPPPRTVDDDVALIRVLVANLAQRNMDLHRDWKGAQEEIVALSTTSTRTQEKLSAEQSQSLTLLRAQAEQARKAEAEADAIVSSLRAQLTVHELEKQSSISRDEFAELHLTSQGVLNQCRELVREKDELEKKLSNAKEEARHEIVRLNEEILNRDATIRALRQTVEDRSRSLNAQQNMAVEHAQLMADFRRLTDLLQQREEEVRETRHQVAQLQLTLSQLEIERGELIASFDENSRELVRVQGVLNSINTAHRVVAEQNAYAHKLAQEINTTVNSPRVKASPPASIIKPFPSPSLADIPLPVHSAGALTVSQSDSGDAENNVPVHVRHHRSGTLSISLNEQQHPPTARLSSVNRPHRTSGDVLHTAAPDAVLRPMSNLRTPSSTTSSSTTTHRVQFSSDTKR